MNLSGILIETKPEWLSEVARQLNCLDGVEVHQVDEAAGRIIAVQEATDIHAEVESLKKIKALPHVILAEMVYHYIAEDEKTYESLPPDLQAPEGGACAVPNSLQN